MTDALKLDAAPVGDPNVIRLLESALADARAGRVAAVGLVVVGGPHKVAAVAAGGLMMELHTGAAKLTADLMAAMWPAGGNARGGILLPRRM